MRGTVAAALLLVSGASAVAVGGSLSPTTRATAAAATAVVAAGARTGVARLSASSSSSSTGGSSRAGKISKSTESLRAGKIRMAASGQSAAGARAGVIGRLFPMLKGTERVLRAGTFSEKRRAALRWRVAQSRASVDRATREIQALEALDAPLTEVEAEARGARIAELRREAGVAESRIILLKAKQRQLGFESRKGWVGEASRSAEKFLAGEERSARVLLSQLAKVRDPWALVRQDTVSLLRLGSSPELVRGYAQLQGAPRLAPHAAAIAARATKLERYAPGILLAVDGHLDYIEPHLDQILEKLDQIEPHLPFVLAHLDVLAPHCGVLLRHIDALLLYADDGGKYLEPLLPYVARFAPQLDRLGPHLALLRPHMRKLLPHMPVVAPTAFRFANYLACSANADILLFYFGWVLRLPLGGWVLRLPFLPRLANFLVKWLPRWPVRGRTAYLYEDWEGCDVAGYTTELAAASASAQCGGVWGDTYGEKRQRSRSTASLIKRVSNDLDGEETYFDRNDGEAVVLGT